MKRSRSIACAIPSSTGSDGTAIDLEGTTFHYIVLEYLPGGDMFALTRAHGRFRSSERFYLEQVCSGLAHAHKCGVIHRDIKPQNLC